MRVINEYQKKHKKSTYMIFLNIFIPYYAQKHLEEKYWVLIYRNMYVISFVCWFYF